MYELENVDLRLLRVFMKVVECGGFSAAQTELGVSQSTISNQMSSLELRLGCTLCQRGRIGFSLTDNGMQVYESSRRLFKALEDFKAETSLVHGQLSGTLHFGITDNTVTDSNAPLHNAIRGFNTRTNQAHIHLQIDAVPELQRQVLDGRMHAALASPLKKLPALNYSPMYSEDFHLYCGQDHPLFAVPDEKITLREVRNSRLISRQHAIERDQKALGVDESAATVNQLEAQLILTRSGGYVGFLPHHYALPWIERGELRLLLKTRLHYTLHYKLITRRGATSTLLLSTFIAELEKAFKSGKNEDSGEMGSKQG